MSSEIRIQFAYKIVQMPGQSS